ncbi:MAG: hypothetical protein PHX82_08960 [Paracoccaceae bacterium]|nr:hypothetical protein [Paracoccaceae bacterium]
MKKTLLTLTLLGFAQTAAAGALDQPIQTYLDQTLRSWATNPVVVDAITMQNAAHAGLDAAQIETLDQAWRAEIGATDQPTIAPVLNNPASDFLRAQLAATQGRVTEAFVTDNLGLNVAMAGLTSDYWQGDEDKFTATYPKGADAVHLGEVEFDESTQTYQLQVSFTVINPATGAPIGAMTVALDAESLQ